MPADVLNINHWRNISPNKARTWTCGYCGAVTGNDRGYEYNAKEDTGIVICGACGRPTFFEKDNHTPAVAFGMPIGNLPDDLSTLYDDARNCMIVKAFTASVLVCRKILMHIAAEHGAETEKKSFQYFVNYLLEARVITERFKTWVDRIRTRSNEANHELVVMSSNDATDILLFVEMLLKVLYEYPNRATVEAARP